MQSTLNLPLTKTVEQAINIAQAKAREYHQSVFSGGHLLWGLLREEAGLHPFLEDLGQSVHRIRAWAELRIENAPKTARRVEQVEADEKVEAILQEAYRLRSQRVESEITTLTVLEALCTPEIGFTASQLKRFPLTLQQVQEGRSNISRLAEALDEAVDAQKGTGIQTKRGNKIQSSKTGTAALDKYCDDLTAKAKAGKIDPVIGRDEELKKLVEYLGKRLSLIHI